MKVEGVKGDNLSTIRRLINFSFSAIGFIVVVVDFILAKRSGEGLCHAESCRIIAQSSFSHLLGLPLNFIGLLYFLLLLVLSFNLSLFYDLLCIGLGVSLYLWIIQFFVLGNICTFCIVVESIILLLFILNFKNLKRSLFSIFFSFVFVHALYTFPPFEEKFTDQNLARAFTWNGNGSVVAYFYFDPFCPHCSKAYDLIKNGRFKFAKLEFRPVLISDRGMNNLIRFYRLSLVEGPWIAFERTHGVSDLKSEIDPLLVARIRVFVKRNLKTLESLGINGVPVLVVKDEKRSVTNVFEGLASIESYFGSHMEGEKKQKPTLESQGIKVPGVTNGSENGVKGREVVPNIDNSSRTEKGIDIRGSGINIKGAEEGGSVCTPSKNCTD